MSPPPLRRLAFVAVSVTAIALTLTACVGERVPGNASANSTSNTASPTSPSATSPSPSPSPSPSASAVAPPDTPEAADGTDLTACADGECEVRVTASAELPVPSSTTVEGLRIESITTEDLAFTGRTTGNSSIGSCTGRCRVSSSNGMFRMALGVGGTGRQNGLAVTLVAISNGHAVVRLGPV